MNNHLSQQTIEQMTTANGVGYTGPGLGQVQTCGDIPWYLFLQCTVSWARIDCLCF